jgi:hypothetical protein
MVSNVRNDEAVSRPSPKASNHHFSSAMVDTDPLFPMVGSGWDSENRNSRLLDRGEICFASPKPSPAKSFKVGSPAMSKLSLNGGNIPMSRRGCNILSKLSDTESIQTVQVNSILPGGPKHIPTVKSHSSKDLAYDYVFLQDPHISIERKGSKRLSSSSIQAVDRFASRGQGYDLCDYDSTILTVAIVTISAAILACWSFAILVMDAGR